MYPTQQVAYSLDNKKYRRHRHFQYHAAAKTDNNDLFLIGNQHLACYSLPSMHQQNYYLQHGLSSTLHSTSSSSSSSPMRFGSYLLPTTGHTLHWIDNALVSFFGKPNQSAVTIIETKHSSSYISSLYLASSSPSPSRRYAHTTTHIRNKNNTTEIYLIGGSAIENDEPLGDIWKLDWGSKTWINLSKPLGPFELGVMGHVTLALPHQSSTLMTCFGANRSQHAFFQHCTLFDTISLAWKRLQPSSSVQIPAPRIYTSMIPANGTHAILYGGISSTADVLGDLWWVDLGNIDSTSSTITFTPLTHFVPRAGHVALMVSDTLMLVDGGQHDGLLESEATMIDLASVGSSSAFGGHQKRDSGSQLPAEEVARDSIQSSSSSLSSSQGSSISGGAIGGIIVAVILSLGVTITLFVFYQRRQRRQRNYDLHSRAVRFSLSTPPRPSESFIEQPQQRNSVIQHPEAAKTRLSHMSFGSEFYVGLDIDGSRSSVSSLPARSKATTASTSSVTPNTNTNNNHSTMLDSPSRQLYTNWVCETLVPPSAIAATTSEYNLNSALDPRHTSMYINQSTLPNSVGHNNHDENNDDDDDQEGAKKRSSTAFKRFRLSIFRPLDIGSSITEQPGNTSQQQQQSHSSPTKTGDGGPSLSSPPTHDAAGSDHQPTTSTSKRRSSMFGLSRFLNIGESATGGGEHDRVDDDDVDGLDRQKQQVEQQQQQVYPPYHRHHYQAEARASLGSKSVASLQWVEFNNDMDFDSGLPSRHLAVMNHHRQSVATISSSSGFGSTSVDDLSLSSKPTSPRNTLIMAQQQPSFYQRSHHPSSSSSSYRLGHRELQSWDDSRLSRLGTSPPPSSSSTHHYLSATRDPTKTNSFPTLVPLNID